MDKNRILQAVLLLAICMWLLYLVNSYHSQENDHDHIINLSRRNLSSTLGRKGLAENTTTRGISYSHGKNARGEHENGENASIDYEIDVNIDGDTVSVLKFEEEEEEEEEETRVLNGKREATEAEFLQKQVLYNISVVDDNGEDVIRVEAFPDENGVPPDATYFTSSMEPRGGEPKNLDMSINESTNLLEIQDDENAKRTQNIIEAYQLPHESEEFSYLRRTYNMSNRG